MEQFKLETYPLPNLAYFETREINGYEVGKLLVEPQYYKLIAPNGHVVQEVNSQKKPSCCGECLIIFDEINRIGDYFFHINSESSYIDIYDLEKLKSFIIKSTYATLYLIDAEIDNKNGLEKIINYINGVVDCLGSPMIGVEWYLDSLKLLITTNKGIHCKILSEYNLIQLLDFMEGFLPKEGEEGEEAESVLDMILRLKEIYELLVKAVPRIKTTENRYLDFQGNPYDDFMKFVLKDKMLNQYIGEYKYDLRTDKELEEYFLKRFEDFVFEFDLSKFYDSISKQNRDEFKNFEKELVNEIMRQKKYLKLSRFSEHGKVNLRAFCDFLETIEELLDKQKLLTISQKEEGDIEKIIKPTNKPIRGQSKDISFLELFRFNEDRVKLFFMLLLNEQIQAIAKNEDRYSWIYNTRKSSIVACFEALQDLKLIKELPKAALQRTVATEISFLGNSKLFRNPINQDDFNEFRHLFTNHLK